MTKRKIAKINPQKRDPQRKTLIFDDGSVFGISEDVFLSGGFAIGDELSDDNLHLLEKDEYQSKVYNSALRLLGYRMRSCAEMKRRLLEKDYPEDIIDNTIDKLSKIGYLNDKEFSIAFTRDKVRSKSIGPIAIRSELLPHRIDSNLADAAIDEVYTEFPIPELIKRLLTKRNIVSGTKLEPKVKKRTLDLLKRKGFSWDDISDVLTELEIE